MLTKTDPHHACSKQISKTHPPGSPTTIDCTTDKLKLLHSPLYAYTKQTTDE